MDEQARTHCRLDLHKVQSGDLAMTYGDFVMKWGRDLDEFLIDPLDDATSESMGATEDALNSLRHAVNEEIVALDKLCDPASSVEWNQEAIGAAIGESTEALKEAMKETGA